MQTSLDYILSNPKHGYNDLIYKNQRVKIFIDTKTECGKFIRMNYKVKSQFFPAIEGVSLDLDFFKSIEVQDFAVSDNLDTVNTEYSWIIENVQFEGRLVQNSSGSYPPIYLDSSLINHNQCILNVFNGKTPTGTEWNINYDRGYLGFNGKLKTLGKWNKMYVGGNWSSYYNVGEKVDFRSGGCQCHTGKYIHTCYNGYRDIDHSVTARTNWNNTRVFWIRIKEKQFEKWC